MLLGTYTNSNYSFFWLVSGIRKQGYIILNCNHNITSKDIIRKFNGDCYYSIITYPMMVQSTVINDSDNNYYCNQSFYDNMENKNYPNGIKVHDYTYEFENQKKKNHHRQFHKRGFSCMLFQIRSQKRIIIGYRKKPLLRFRFLYKRSKEKSV